jgi:hypothetical protein
MFGFWDFAVLRFGGPLKKLTKNLIFKIFLMGLQTAKSQNPNIGVPRKFENRPTWFILAPNGKHVFTAFIHT